MTSSRYLIGFVKNHFHEKLEEGGMKATTLPDQSDVIRRQVQTLVSSWKANRVR